MKYIIIICCCFLFGSTAVAQHLVGARGGYGFHRMQFMVQNPPEQSWTNGLSAGVVYRTLNTPHLGLQLELLMEQKAWHLYPNTEQTYKVEEQHLTLPIQSVVIAGSGRFRFVFTGGAYASYILGEEVVEDGPDTSNPIKFERQPKQDWQYGVLGGMGPAMRIGRNWLQLEGRFAYTLSNRLAPNLKTTDAFNATQQMSVTISLVWLTQLGRL